ncbi:EF-hand domain-containing protein [Halocynthiibacter sp. C4]|uniref:EF-hand domain-containing protein n=1 Tax=Halocynthiibacter sp. C4 TaxID=2992758 RepID=UPI00237BA5C9|nr:EF-hand domain-containing protein [Halocynthiibacter sp. C4]MDE0588989.1 EF-hand domain-containing protein [Halocynthiibacter sp. C4]
MKHMTLIAGLSAGLLLVASAGAAISQTDGEKGDKRGGARFNIEEIDTNGDGMISQEEIAAHQAARFKAMDTDGDGKISSEEMAAQADKKRAERKENRSERMIKALDKDGDGLVSEEEMQARSMGDDMFEKLDTDGDGLLSMEELKAGHKHMGKKKGKRGPKGERGSE